MRRAFPSLTRKGSGVESWVDGPRIRFGAAVLTALLVGYVAAEWIFVATLWSVPCLFVTLRTGS